MRQLAILVVLIGVCSMAHATESLDQYLNRMQMRMQDEQFQDCLDQQRMRAKVLGTKANFSACVPPDYATPQEAWVSGEWRGTEGDL